MQKSPMIKVKGQGSSEGIRFDVSKSFEIFTRISEKINRLTDLKTTLDEILAIISEVSGIMHLAIRMVGKSGDIPFYSHRGLPKKFLDSEHWVTTKDCLCGYIARSEVDKSLPYITEFGSFFTSDMSGLASRLKKPQKAEEQIVLRNTCCHFGFDSVAIIPVKVKDRIIAELYLSDKQKNRFTPDLIRFIEQVSSQVGIAIENSQLFTELQDSRKKLMSLFHSTTVGIIELDSRGTIEQINRTGAELLGLSPAGRVLDQNVRMDALNLGKEEWKTLLESADRDGTVENMSVPIFIGKGEYYLEFSLTTVKDGAGNITGYRGTYRDITDSIRLKEERINAVKAETLKNRYYQESQILKDELKSRYPFEEMIGKSKAIQKVKKAIQQVAPTDTTVLIKGETGTGKELVARYIHELCRRNDRILVKVNCAALSEGLIASELFGHEKGAFTGAVQRRIGRFEYADNATIFLDEIGDLPPETQAMILRVLQDGEFERVGSSKTIKVDVRILAATNRDLDNLVREKKFRQDLFYRLNVFPIEVAPLRSRKEDIPLLTAYFLDVYGRNLGKKIQTVSDQTLKIFQEYSWPGNVRELQNIIEHGLIVSKGSTLDIPQAYFRKIPAAEPGTGLISLQDHERNYILKILKHTNGVVYGVNGAAVILGMKPSTLQSRMKKLGIDRSLRS